MKGGSKKRKRVRKRRWTEHDVDAVKHERRRHRGRDSGTSPDELEPKEYFSDIEPNAVVVSPYGVLVFVEMDGREVLCRAHDDLVDGKTSILAPGDRVFVKEEKGVDEPVVKAVVHRRGKLGRPAVGSDREQVFAANIDAVVIVAAAARPPFRPGLVDRYLIATEIGGVAPILCVNKMDLVDEEPAEVELYRSLDMPVVLTSCVTGEGIETLRGLLQGKRACLAGHSGVGKSSLINALDPQHDIETQTISDLTNKGRHTTSTSRLYHLRGDIHIVDTPGIRQLGLWGVSAEEVDFYFPEMQSFAAECKFRDCTHLHEPQCAVREAVESGEIAPARYESYKRIRESLEES